MQEVGSTKNTYASGSNGKKSPFLGIYNYYNIGAYSGGMEGLEWASGYLKANEKTTLYSSYNSSKGTVGGTKTTVSKGQYMTYIGTYGKYYKVKLYTGSGNSFSTNGKVGYIINSNDVLRKKYFNYDRPWTNPYKSIIGGAPYIAKGFSKYQNTGYLNCSLCTAMTAFCCKQGYKIPLMISKYLRFDMPYMLLRTLPMPPEHLPYTRGYKDCLSFY